MMAELKSGVIYGDLAALDTGGGVVSLLNPEEVDVIITRFVLDITTKSTGACTLDGGPVAAATTVGDTVIDGLDVNSAAGVFDNIKNQAGNGLESERWESDEYFTLSKKTGAAAGLIGTYYIEYIRV